MSYVEEEARPVAPDEHTVPLKTLLKEKFIPRPSRRRLLVCALAALLLFCALVPLGSHDRAAVSARHDLVGAPVVRPRVQAHERGNATRGGAALSASGVAPAHAARLRPGGGS